MSKELVVQALDPAALDRIVQQFGAVVGQNADGSYHADHRGHYAIRRADGGDLGFVRFMLVNQGYAKVIEERDV